MSNFAQVKQWHRAFGVPVGQGLVNIPPDRQELRYELIREEFEELYNAMLRYNFVEIADGLADLLYVVYGTAVEYGIPIDDVFAEVHKSNMSKLGEDGKPIYREDGKVLKGPNFVPPDIAKVLADEIPIY